MMNILSTKFGLYLSDDFFYNSVKLSYCQFTKLVLKSKIILKLKNGILFVYVKLLNGNDFGLINMNHKIIQ